MRTRAHTRWAVTLALGTGLVAPMAQAANDAMLDLLKVLRDNGTINAEAYEQLSGAAKADDEANTADTAQVKQSAAALPKIDTNGKFEVTSPSGEHKFQVGGRLQVDAAWYDEEESDLTGEQTVLDSGTEVRRARLHAAGTVFKYWDFKSEVDFAENEVDIKDAYIANTYLKPLTIQVGNFKEPFSLEQLTSSRFITFMERSLADAFVPERNLGAQLHYFGGNWTAATGAFSEGIDDDDEDTEVDGGEGIGATTRATFAPLMASNQLVHLGGAFSYRNPEDPDNEAGGTDEILRFRARPESHIADTRLVDTGTIGNVDDFYRYGAEVAGAMGPVSLQGEYIYTDVERNVNDNLDFHGWYALASWFLTGESRAAFYKPERGAFDRVKPFANFGYGGGWGAWELAARYSGIDLNDEDIFGGEEQNFTFAINWYPNPNIRLMSNYVHVVDVDEGDFDGVDPNIFQFRAQVDF